MQLISLFLVTEIIGWVFVALLIARDTKGKKVTLRASNISLFWTVPLLFVMAASTVVTIYIGVRHFDEIPMGIDAIWSMLALAAYISALQRIGAQYDAKYLRSAEKNAFRKGAP